MINRIQRNIVLYFVIFMLALALVMPFLVAYAITILIPFMILLLLIMSSVNRFLVMTRVKPKRVGMTIDMRRRNER